MTHRHPLSRALLVGSLGLALFAPPVASQEEGPRLSGLILTESTGVPVEGAHIRLVDPSDVVLAEALSDERGAFGLPMPPPGVYRVRVTRIGYQSWASDTLHVTSASASRTLRLEVPVQPIPLPEMSVSEQNVCPTTPEERRRAFELYESVLPILTTVSSTSDLGELRMRMIRPTVVWRRGAYRYAADTVTVDVRTSLNNALPEYLEAHGYAEVLNDSMTTFYAPGGDALASPGFLATHCLSTVEDADETRIGLGFEPKPGRRVVDVKGVLWIDIVAGGPRQLEFRYTSLLPFLRRHLEPAFRVWELSRFSRGSRLRYTFHPIEIDESRFGGLLQFERVPENTVRDRWLIREWTIVRPRLAYKGLYEMGKRATIWPRVEPLATSGKVLALIRP